MSAAVPTPVTPAVESAREAGLSYVNDTTDAGITRVRKGRGFVYRGPDGKPVRDRGTLERIRTIVIPPAWTRVWIAAKANAHIQATGRDARGRKQYRYHPKWTAARDETKYGRMLPFAKVLPQIRRRLGADLRRAPLSRERVLATVVALLERTHIRVGNEEYAKANGSFGLTTLLDRHVDVRGAKVRFRFRAKSGVMQAIDLDDARLARSVQRCQDLPGQTLFQYLDEQGERRSIGSSDVNAYLRSVAGGELTAKDFRTWAGTVLAACALCAEVEGTSQTAKTRFVTAAVGRVADRLGNTKAVCRRCYIHPAVLDAFFNGETIGAASDTIDADALLGRLELSVAERAVVRLLQKRLPRATARRQAA